VAIKLTERASSELKTLKATEVEASRLDPEAGLRLVVVGGGCAGFAYRIGFDENISQSDKVFEEDGVKVVVDERSFLYLDATVIDYQETPAGRGFVFHNPNARGTCSCSSACSG
jgi:iron-sulfur cluster assembly protein